MKRVIGCLLTVISLHLTSEAQNTRYIVRFRDKGNNPYSITSPSAFLSQKAINRRSRYSIAIDSTDLPVSPPYIDSVRSAGSVIVLNSSKWLNSISIYTNDAAALIKISGLPFVLSVSSIAARLAGPAGQGQQATRDLHHQATGQFKEARLTADYFDYGLSLGQVALHNGTFLHNIGLRGQNMVIGMLDGGFNNYRTVKSLDSIRINGQVLSVYDFVSPDSSVNEDDAHGMECLSVIAANIPGQFIGTAPKAGFHLFRTENSASEYPIEEHYWVSGAERIDSAGGDVISSSLGYSDAMSNPAFNHTYAEMNGNTTMAAIGADLAAKKGILVVNSAGNDGTRTFRYIGTPADGDSVLAVGAVTIGGVPANFSSYGPTSDGRVKPDVASVGVATVVQLPNNAIGTNNGTSFAGPNMAGLATCLWQGFPEFNNMHIMRAIRAAGSKATSPDDRVGYGIPNMKMAVMNLLKDYALSNVSISNCTATLQWRSKDVSSMKYVIERRLAGQSDFVPVAERVGTGAVFGNRTYEFKDELKNIPVGAVHYRILQVIDTSFTGYTAAYIDTISSDLSLVCPGKDELVAIPNPVRQTLTLKLSALAPLPDVTVMVFNSKGQLINRMSANKPEGVYFMKIPLPLTLSAGKYYVKLFSGSTLFATTEFIKLLH